MKVSSKKSQEPKKSPVKMSKAGSSEAMSALVKLEESLKGVNSLEELGFTGKSKEAMRRRILKLAQRFEELEKTLRSAK